jgi:hypothetical protein
VEIYLIRNKQNGKGYVGATKWTFKDRYPQGKWWRWTHSPHLRCAYEKYGLEAFEVSILENDIPNETVLYEREAHYIAELGTFIPGGYNLTRGGGSADPMFVREYDLIDFDGNMYHVVNLRLFCRRRKLNYSAMCSMVAGISRSSHGFALPTTPIEEIVIPDEEWTIENVETGEVEILRRGNIRKWAKERRLNPHAIEKVVYGETLVSQGWKLASTVLPESYRGSGPKVRATLIAPNGESVKVDNVYAFAREHNLDRGQLYDLINGRALEHKGWRCIADENEWEREKDRRRGRSLDVISPSGESLRIKNVSAFCRERELNINSFFALVNGRSSCYRGWKLA